MVKDRKLAGIFLNYRSYLRQLVGKITQREDIDDIVQETFVKTYEADLKKEIKYVRSYMVTTAKNLALNHEAKCDQKLKESLEDFTELPVELSSRKFEDEFASKERFLLFCQASEHLPSSVRKCFILKKVYGLSQKEIAQYLNLSESTVEKHVAKGLLLCVQYMQNIEQEGDKQLERQSQEVKAVHRINE